jgi:hypothetical protein
VEDDLETIQIRDERMKQLKAAAEASQQKLQQACSHRAGELVDIPATALLRVVNVQDYMIVLLRSGDGGARHGAGDDVPTPELPVLPEMRHAANAAGRARSFWRST